MSDERKVIEVNREYIRKKARNGERLDGRDFDEFRDLDIEAGYIRETAEGSAMVELGGTKLLVGIKADIGSPYDDAPDSGTLITNVELGPIAAKEYESGPPREDAVELARVVDRGLRESGVIKMEDLGITDGEKCWLLFIDVHVLDYDGNLLDAAFIGAVTALMDGQLPAYDAEEDELDRETHVEDIPVKDFPVTLTGRKVADQVMLDTDAEEEQAMDARLTVTLNEDDEIVSLQKGEEGELTIDEVMDIVGHTHDYTTPLREKVKEALAEA